MIVSLLLFLACVVPPKIDSQIAARFEGWRVVTIDDVDKETRDWLKTARPGECPGVISGDFFGDGSRSYAVVITRQFGTTGRSKIVVWHRDAARWKYRVIDTYSGLQPPVLRLLPPGNYTDVYGEKTHDVKHDLVVAVDYGVTEVAYIWNGKQFEKLWLSD